MTFTPNFSSDPMPSGPDFKTIYQTDLVYVPNCWQLCGNAHCCNFSRLKSKFAIIGSQTAQELPLLPGEYDYLRSQGWLGQFGDHDHRVIEYEFGHRRLRVETIISRRPGCACDHATRPTVCRLYPLLPVFDSEGRLAGVDRLGIYDCLEALDELPHICQVQEMPLAELRKFLAITQAIAGDAIALFYVRAYKLVQDHVQQRLTSLRGESSRSFFSVFETATLRQRLIEQDALSASLEQMALEMERRTGPLVFGPAK